MWKKSVMDKVDKFMESQVNTLSVLGSRVQRFSASGFFISINPIGLRDLNSLGIANLLR